MKEVVKMYSALMIAAYIIIHENEKRRVVSNLRLQKLLYFAQAQSLYSDGEPCFLDRIEAWDFGPVVPTVYRAYKIYGSSSIPDTNYHYNYNDISEKKRHIIDNIVDYCSRYSTSQLVSITHSQSPWIIAYNRPYDHTIHNEEIKSFFGG